MTVRIAKCLCGPRAHARPAPVLLAATRVADAKSGSRGRADPTGTSGIQRRWNRDLDARWAVIKRMMPRAVQDRVDPVGHIHTSYLTGQPDPVVAFQGWLDEAMRQFVFGINGAWLLPYVRSASDVGALHARTSATRVRDAFNPDQPRDDHGRWSAEEAVANLHTLPEVTGSDRHFDPSFGGEDYGPEVTVRSAGFERTPESWITKPVTSPTLGRVPLDKVVINQSAATKGLVEKYIRNPPQEPVDFVEHEGKFYATSGTHRLVAAKMRGLETISARIFQLKGKGKKKRVRDAASQLPADRTHILQSLAITELQGIIEATSQRAVRAFADGYLRQQTPAAISAAVRQVIDSVGRQRSQLLTSFMTVKAHATATLDGLRALGVTRVGLIPERAPPAPRLATDAKSKKGMVQVLTAEDDDVCPVCEEIAQDGPYYIDEAEHLIPAHPRCRCAFAPADEDEREEFLDAFNPDQPRAPDGKWATSGDYVVAYHGTTTYRKTADKIWKEGIKVGQKRSYGDGDLYKDQRGRSVFVAKDMKTARWYAAQKALGESSGKMVVFELHIPKKEWASFYNDEEHTAPATGRKVSGAAYRPKSIPRSWVTNRITLDAAEEYVTRYLVIEVDPEDLQDSTTHVAAGVMITADDTGRTLFVRRKSGDQPGTWAFPGGAVEPGETIDGAAARETREEIGYDPSADLEQGHRGEHNGVDFTTYLHNTAREFRPHLNHEHDAYKWALVEQAPEPLHPGVARTLDAMDTALRLRDQEWSEELHPRDKTGKFTDKPGVGVDPVHATNLMAKLKADPFLGKYASNFKVEKTATGGWEISAKDLGHWVNPPDAQHEDDYDWQEPTDETKQKLSKLVNEFAAAHGLKADLSSGEKNYSYIKLEPKASKSPEPTPAHVEQVIAQLKEPTPAPPPPHPLEKHLSKVSGTSSERVAMRAKMKGLKYDDPALKELQERHNASFWKQYQQSIKQGKLGQASEIESKLDKYSKSYGISNPLKQPKVVPIKTATPAPQPAPVSAKNWDVNKPDENFAKSLESQGIPVNHGTFGPNSPHAGQKYVAFGAATDKQKDLAKVIAKYHPQMEPIPESQTIYKPKSGAAQTATPAPQHISSAHAMAADLMKLHGKHSNVDETPEYYKISTSTVNKKELAEIAKKYPDAQLMPNMQSTYMVPKTSVALPQPSSVAPKPTFGKAESKPAQEPLDFNSLKKVGDQKGSNPGGVYEDASGNKFYVKTMDEAHAKNELLAARLYALAGARTLDYVPVKPNGDQHYVATKFEKLDKDNVSKLNPYEKQTAQQDFAVHAWLANWDAAGTGGDNQGVKDGIVKTLDVGGALEYRAKGTPKDDDFGNEVNEFDTLRDSNKNADAAALYGKMTDDQIKASVNRLKDLNAFEIKAVTDTVYGNSEQSKALANKLEARRKDLLQRVEEMDKVKVAKGTDLSHMSEEEQRIHWLKQTIGGSDLLKYHMGTSGDLSDKTLKQLQAMGLTPAETGFIRAFTGPSSDVNKEMRDGVMNEHVFAFKHIMNEALDKFPTYDGDKVWRKIQLNDAQQALYEPGKIVHWQAFSSTSKNPDTWNGNTHFTIHSPKSGRDVQFISENPGEAEVIMPADTYYRVLSKKSSGGITHIELEEVIPFGKKKKKAA